MSSTKSTVCILWISLSFLVGCGLTLNGPATTSPVTVVNASGIGPVIPAPALSHALTGCTNPNTGVATDAWGVGTDPVYTSVSNTTPIVGTPVYSSNAIFWTSRENAPGQSILLTGAFTDGTKTARIAYIPAGAVDWQSMVRASATVVPTTQQGTTGLSFLVPTNFLAGVYGFQIEDPTTSPVLGLANVPALNWAIGTPTVIDPTTALQHQVYDCGAEPGETLRLFGKNFVASDRVILQASNGASLALSPSRLDSNSVSVAIPNTAAPGTYNVWLGNSPWDTTSSPSAGITIYAPPSRAINNSACSGLVGDGVTDNTERLQSCLDRYAPLGNGNQALAYISIPAGNFVLTGAVTAHSFEVLLGSPSGDTKFLGLPRGAPPAAWFKVPCFFGMANISLKAAANPTLLLSSGTETGDPSASGHLFFDHVDFASTDDFSHGGEVMFALAGPDIQVYDSRFLSNSFQALDINFGDGAVVTGNQLILNNWTGLGISDSQNVIFEKNETYSQNPVGQGPNGRSGGAGLSISRGNSQYGRSALSQDIYVGYNSFHDMGSNDQQVITNDGDGGAYIGPVASSTAQDVSLADDPEWNWMGTSNPQAAVMAIIAGTGVGQYSFLQSYLGRDIKLLTPWTTPPDTSSLVVISQYELNMTIAHNTIQNTLGASIVLGNALEGVIEDNSMTNSGAGILISAFGPYGGPAAYGPVINNDVLRNTIAMGAGNLIWNSVNTNTAGIGVQDLPGCLESGLMIRDNVVTAIDAIYNVDGLNGVTANLVEQNQANWTPTFPSSGFLVQNNTSPTP